MRIGEWDGEGERCGGLRTGTEFEELVESLEDDASLGVSATRGGIGGVGVGGASFRASGGFEIIGE